jgi:hypothetical protein
MTRFSMHKPVLTTWPDPDEEPEETEPEPLDLWNGDDHSEEDLRRVKEVAHSR